MKIRTFLAVGGWCVLAFAVAQKEKAGQTQHPTFTAPTPEIRIMTINTGYQSAFDDLSEYDAREVSAKASDGSIVKIKIPKKFPPHKQQTFMPLHNYILRESNVPMASGSTKYTLQIYAVSQLGRPLQPESLQLDQDTGIGTHIPKPDLARQVVAFAVQSLPVIAAKDVNKGQVSGLDAEALPLRVSSEACLSCHSHSKVGDPLAILVYTIKRNKE